MITYVRGDLFDYADDHVIGQGVNCKGVMGAGIAASFAERYPQMYEEYRDLCKYRDLRPGQVHSWVRLGGRPSHVIFNMCTQDRPGAHARLDWLRECMVWSMNEALDWDRPLAIPMIGAGIGGLLDVDVRAVFEEVAVEFPYTDLVVVLFDPSVKRDRRLEVAADTVTESAEAAALRTLLDRLDSFEVSVERHGDPDLTLGFHMGWNTCLEEMRVALRVYDYEMSKL